MRSCCGGKGLLHTAFLQQRCKRGRCVLLAAVAVKCQTAGIAAFPESGSECAGDQICTGIAGDSITDDLAGEKVENDTEIHPVVIDFKKNGELTNAIARGKINSLGLRDVEDGKKEREKSDTYKMQARAMEIDYPQTSVILRILANFYERESKRDQIISEIGPLQ